MFHGIKGREEQRKLSKSFYNTVEAQQVLQYCRTLLGDHERPVSPEEIGIISPYKAQVRYIKSMLRGARIEGVTVGSVEQFQGQERRVIILSTTRSNFNRNKKAFGFLNDPHRLNVALTRAQAMLIVIGDPTVLGQDLLWRTFLNYVHKRGGRMGERYDWDPEEDFVPRGYERISREQARAEGEEFLNMVRTEVLVYRGV
ncbi:hypothetical protein EVG20_g3185 [Dentipellis fragilis]|uniref:DNA2/NAM7 helicase-like C-terminal domain-containing protein n=1 Tax=Dentipellis fragilis TaxID=205917 RepID=A0A4Y9Z7H4_9AGAM|nr:hypothetical protein EVG20_g3185 [Dentipellis fragilis]